MLRRVRFMKRLLFRVLLTASLLIAPLLGWVRMPLSHADFEQRSERTEATGESFVDDAEWEAWVEEARANSGTRARARQKANHSWQEFDSGANWIRGARFAFVVDVRRIKPKRLFAPPYLRPRVVRLLS
jgi:hypothetical protein